MGGALASVPSTRRCSLTCQEVDSLIFLDKLLVKHGWGMLS
nr:MAG TPA: hypothetical protein [Caudoviricetes sp.]